MAEVHRYWRVWGAKGAPSGTYPIDALPEGVTIYYSDAVPPDDAPDDWRPPEDSWRPITSSGWAGGNADWTKYEFPNPVTIEEIEIRRD